MTEMTAPVNKAGQMAWQKKSIVEANVGRLVTVELYIGYMKEGTIFTHNGINTKMPITDHYWWITNARGIETPYGPTARAMAPDKWLHPIPPDILDESEETGAEVYNTKPETVDA